MAKFFVADTNIGIDYARAFFVIPPDASPLMAGEQKTFPMKYDVGNPTATAFELHWYATQTDADAFENRLTDASRLPTATFVPATPNDATGLQDGNVFLTAPTTNGYENPVGVIEMTQDTGEFVEPYIYLTEDVLVWERYREYRDYQFKYWIGEPAVHLFHIEWYPTRVAANLRVNRLRDVSRLPRAVFTPETPNMDADADEVQEGTLRLYPSTDEYAYTRLEGLLCVSYLTEIDANETTSVRNNQVLSNYDINSSRAGSNYGNTGGGGGSNWDRGR